MKKTFLIKNKVIQIFPLKIYKFKSLGKGFRFIDLKNVFHADNISIGENVYFGRNIYIDAIQQIVINDGTMIGPNCTIISGSHNYNSADLKSIPFDNKMKKGRVVIEQNVWIGANVCISANLTIGEGSVVGMGAVITKDVPPFSVVVGNPARIIKFRDEKVYSALKKKHCHFSNLFLGKGFEFYE